MNLFEKGGFPKTSVFGKATLDFMEKSGPQAAFSRSPSQNSALSVHSQLVLGQAQGSR
jgi:hypothetical protein